jgi:hypothetical protein
MSRSLKILSSWPAVLPRSSGETGERNAHGAIFATSMHVFAAAPINLDTHHYHHHEHRTLWIHGSVLLFMMELMKCIYAACTDDGIDKRKHFEQTLKMR